MPTKYVIQINEARTTGTFEDFLDLLPIPLNERAQENIKAELSETGVFRKEAYGRVVEIRQIFH